MEKNYIICVEFGTKKRLMRDENKLDGRVDYEDGEAVIKGMIVVAGDDVLDEESDKKMLVTNWSERRLWRMIHRGEKFGRW